MVPNLGGIYRNPSKGLRDRDQATLSWRTGGL
jgi:hypothetical protein